MTQFSCDTVPLNIYLIDHSNFYKFLMTRDKGEGCLRGGQSILIHQHVTVTKIYIFSYIYLKARRKKELTSKVYNVDYLDD